VIHGSTEHEGAENKERRAHDDSWNVGFVGLWGCLFHWGIHFHGGSGWRSPPMNDNLGVIIEIDNIGVNMKSSRSNEE
jgi:hypothetical protein